jgi:hypothetical protein
MHAITIDTPAKPVRRKALADAVARAALLRNTVQDRTEAVTRARDFVTQSEARLDEATKRVADARQERADDLSAAATSGTAPASASTVRRARAAEVNAADELDAARAALAACENALQEAEDDLRRYEPGLVAEAEAVMRQEIPVAEILKEAERLQRDLENRRVALRYALSQGLIGDRALEEAVHEFLRSRDQLPASPGLRGIPGERPYLGADVEFWAWDDHPIAIMLSELRIALTRDADAPIPSIS